MRNCIGCFFPKNDVIVSVLSLKRYAILQEFLYAVSKENEPESTGVSDCSLLVIITVAQQIQTPK